MYEMWSWLLRSVKKANCTLQTTHLVVVLEFIRAFEASIEHRVNILQCDAMIVLDHILVKFLVKTLPKVLPSCSVLQEAKL
jgi:hypothetical protein